MLKSFILVIAFLCLAAPFAQAGALTVISSDNSPHYGEFAAALSEDLNNSNWRIVASRTADNLRNVESTDIIITAGSEAFRQTLQRTSGTPILATLLARQSYEQILRETPPAPRRISAIFLDQPPERQAAFIRKLLPGQRQVAALFGPETRSLAPPYRHAFLEAGLVLTEEHAFDDASILNALNATLPRNAVLLAIPDSKIYRRDSIKAILITAFRYQRPAVGYSAAFVKAGGLAAIYSTPRQIARQAAQTVIAHGTTLPVPAWPRLFAVTINNSVANALGLPTKDEESILQALQSDKEAR